MHPPIIFVYAVKVKMKTCSTGVHTERGSVVMTVRLRKTAGYCSDGFMLLLHILDQTLQHIPVIFMCVYLAFWLDT